MSEQLHSKRDSSEALTPVAEFRRWLIIACAVPIAGTCFIVVAEQISLRVDNRIFLMLFFAAASACEGWLQFAVWWRRLFWIFAGAWTGFFLPEFARHNSVLAAWVFAIPSTIEIFTAFGVRRRPWAWLIGTLALYSSVPAWGETVSEIAHKVTTFVLESLNYTTTQIIVTGLTTVFAVILITRAIVGSFIASTKAT